MSTQCNFTGHLETYGLGIRIAHYLFWYSIPLSTWIARTETKLLRLLHSLLITATFLGLIIQTDRNSLRPVEIYITWLLCFATYLYLVPVYIWRALTCCNPAFDPVRFARVDKGPISEILNFLLGTAIGVFGLWFWFEVAGSSTSRVLGLGFVVGGQVVECREFGFFFSKVGLTSRGFVVGNILCLFLVVVGFAIVAVLTLVKMARGQWLREIIDDDGRSISVTSSEFDDVVDVSKIQQTALQEFDTFLHLLTVSIVLAAIETSIGWNGIKGVNEVGNPSQMIPLVLGVGGVARVLYVKGLGDLDVRYRVRRGGEGGGRGGGLGEWIAGVLGLKSGGRGRNGGGGSRESGSSRT